MLNNPGSPYFRPASYGFAAVCLGCALTLFMPPAYADDWYQVEVALFSFTEPDAGGELWYENPGLPARGQTIALITETLAPQPEAASGALREEDLRPYLALPKREHRLAGVRRALARAAAYQPLLHVVWRQPGLGISDVRAVQLSNTLFEDRAAQPADAPAGETGETVETPQYSPPVKVFDGLVRLRKSRFLHLDVDFAYFPDTLEQPEAGAQQALSAHRPPLANYVRLTESRRIKPDALNYFDHPLFGLIVQVSRLALAEPESPVPGQ